MTSAKRTLVPSRGLSTQQTSSSSMYATWDGKQVVVAFKYSPTQDVWFHMQYLGQSGLFQLGNVYLKPNSNPTVGSDLDQSHYPYPTTLIGTISDWVGPYQVFAVNNPTNSLGQQFTGGWHGYNGDQTGAATAYPISVSVLADGYPLTSSVTACSRVDVVVVNHIQGWNTIQPNGTGRAILQETVHYTFQNGSIDITNNIQALEDVKIDLYYGIQTVNNAWQGTSGSQGTLHYVGGSVGRQTAYNTNADSGPSSQYPNVNRFCLRDPTNTHNLIAWIDPNVGLGNGSYCLPSDSRALTFSYGKSYFRLVSQNNYLSLAQGQTTSWRGGYVFTVGQTFAPADIAYISLDVNGVKSLTVDFLSSGTGKCPVDTTSGTAYLVNSTGGTMLQKSVYDSTGVSIYSPGVGSITVAIP